MWEQPEPKTMVFFCAQPSGKVLVQIHGTNGQHIHRRKVCLLGLQPTRYENPKWGTQIHEKFWVSEIYFIHAFPRRKLLGIQRYNDIISFQISAKMREISAYQQKTDFMGMLADTWASRTDACHQFSPLVHTEDC